MFMYYMDIFMWIQFCLMWIFKLINLWRFVENFSKYDIISKRIKIYWYLYPFFEITLWLFYFFHFQTFEISILALIISGTTLIWLSKATIKKQTWACVCMWKIVKLKIWRTSLIENISMVLMAIWMIIAMRPKTDSLPLRMEWQSQKSIIQHCELMPDMPWCDKIETKN